MRKENLELEFPQVSLVGDKRRRGEGNDLERSELMEKSSDSVDLKGKALPSAKNLRPTLSV